MPPPPEDRGGRPPPEEILTEDDPQGYWYTARWRREVAEISPSAHAPAECPRPQRGEMPPQGPSVRVRGHWREAIFHLSPDDVILVGRDMSGDLRVLRDYAWLLGGVAVGILTLALLGGRWLVSRSLEPIAAISAAADKIARGDLRQRISTEGADSELGQLARTLNHTFERLEASFAHQARFTADAAHELRTPVTVLLTHTQNALNSTCESEEHREAFAACQRAAKRMRALIESLLRLARLDSGEQRISLAEFDLASRVAGSVDLVRPMAEARGITLKTDLPPTPCRADPELTDLVVTNLLTNAIQHNHERGEVQIVTRRESGAVTLTVADRGPGITPENLPRVFDRFHRTDASRNRSSGGVGLGLAITKAIVEAHQGSISADSTPGQGATFQVRLPI